MDVGFSDVNFMAIEGLSVEVCASVFSGELGTPVVLSLEVEPGIKISQT